MTILILGVALWVLAHFFRTMAPSARARMDASMGAGPAKGAIAGIIALSLILMIWGYRSAPWTEVYVPPSWGVHLNNLAMLFAVALFGMGKSKGRARSWLRHPMLTGVTVWALAHLLVNGDLASVILFGSMGVWSVAQMVAINRRDGPWERPEPGPVKGDVRLVAIALVLYAVIAGIHTLLGHSPFPG